MQTSIATVCLSGSLSDNARSAAEAHLEHVELFENETLWFDGEREEILAWIAAMLVPGFVAATVTRLPRALRF